MSIHAVKREQAHLAWDKSIPPVLTVPSGSTVHVSCLDGSNGQLVPTSTATDVANLNLELCVQVNGPVYVQGAQPGDTLQIDVLDIKTADWGWTAVIPGFGLLADEFPEPAFKVWDLSETGTATVSAAGDEAGVDAGGEVLRYAYLNKEKGIRIPIRPFAGEMGVARGVPGAWSTIPPYATGGNVDTKHLTQGSTLYLPIEVEGALFSIGDGHAAQGDGEVCGTAIEAPMEVTVRLTVRKDKPYTKTPHFRTLGGVNSMLYSGDITYIHVTVPGFWQVSMDNVRVNGDTVLETIPAIFDTGANYIYGDWERVSEIYKRIGGTLDEDGAFGVWTLPCDSFPTVSLTFGGRSFEIPPEVLRLDPIDEGSPDCLSAIVAQRSRHAFWIVGMTFLQGVYSVFDYTNSQVGFADLA